MKRLTLTISSVFVVVLLIILPLSGCNIEDDKNPDDSQSTSPASEAQPIQNAPSGVKPEASNQPEQTTDRMHGIVRLSSTAPMQSYTRSEYEPNWDIPGEHCNIRSRLLEQSSTVPVSKNKNCTVTYGKWQDPYSGSVLEGNPYRGDGTENDLDIDHIIPLHYVNNHGGYAWDATKKHQYGASLQSLNEGLYLAVSASENREKSDKGPSQYMPPNQAFVCTYIIKWRDIASAWHISLDPNDYDVINNKLASCE